MIEKYKLDSLYVVSDFMQHLLLKDRLLDLIEDADYQYEEDSGVEISLLRSDYHIFNDALRPWVNFIQQPMIDHMSEVYSYMGYNSFSIHEIWFQQYVTGAKHGWHIHNRSFTNVYFLELPEDAPRTVLINPYTQKNFVVPKVFEGQILTFPSYVIHKSPGNKSEKRKTSVAFNAQIGYPDNTYGLGLENEITSLELTKKE